MLHELHVLSVHIYERHIGENVLNIFVRTMITLYAAWRARIIEAATDSDRMMNGRRQGVPSSVQKVAKQGFMRVWSGANQLEIGMQAFYLKSPESLYSSFTTLVAYLRRQKTFMSQKRSQ